MSRFEIKDGGKRESLAGGMVRDTEDGKTDYTLITDGPMFDRWAEHLTRAALSKYGRRNWMKAAQSDDREAIAVTMDRFMRSAFRHFRAWERGDRDEDHAAALFFNVNGYEYLKEVLLCLDIAKSALPSVPKSFGIPLRDATNAMLTATKWTCRRLPRLRREPKS